MNGITRNSTSCLLGLYPATSTLPMMLQANGHSANSSRPRYDESSSLGPEVAGKTGQSRSDRRRIDGRFDERTANQEGPAHHRVRVALYSHDTMGLGHLRRNLLIAQALAESPLRATTLLITGAHEANFFSLLPGADFLTLPRLHKDAEGRYTAGQLAISVQELISLRAESISSALNAFRPEVMIVDKVPTGAFGEMLPALRSITENHDTHCVLGIRDVLDEAEVVRSEWLQSSHAAIDEFYDELWVYGDQRIFDPVKEYGWQHILAEKVRYTGYLDQTDRLRRAPRASSQEFTCSREGNEPLIVCTPGGGQDGFRLAETFILALPQTGVQGIVLAGPFMPQHLLRSIQESAAGRTNVRVVGFTPEADQLISRADRVVAMGGYNTVCAILSYRKPALLVPRVSPRREQWIRAQRFEQLNLVNMIHPDDLTVKTMRDWLTKEVDQPRVDPEVINFDGLESVAQLASGLLGRKTDDRPTLMRGNV